MAVSFKGKQQTSSIQEKVLLWIYGSTEHGIFRREDEVKLAVVQSIHRSLWFNVMFIDEHFLFTFRAENPRAGAD